MSGAPACPVFYPTLEDINGSFEDYVAKIEKKFAHAGICKIVPPAGWKARRRGYTSGYDFTIQRPIRQHATGRKGLYRTLLIEQKELTLKGGFEPLALDRENAPPKDADAEMLERKFWKHITMGAPMYGADVPGSLFDEHCKGWNLRKLDSLLSRTLEKHKLEVPGVNTPYLYFGMWRSIFAWHTEDMDLHSVNFLHYGANKSWYCIPPPHRARFEVLLKSLLPDLFRHCPEFVRHKELLVSPWVLQSNNIPVVRVVQQPGEFVVNYPGAYHCGFNCGYNCAESTNFATRAWLPFGLKAKPCRCVRDTVKIQMSLFAEDAPVRLRKALLESDAAQQEGSSSEEEEEEEEEGASEVESEAEEGEGTMEEQDSSEEEGDERQARRRRPRGRGGGDKPAVPAAKAAADARALVQARAKAAAAAKAVAKAAAAKRAAAEAEARADAEARAAEATAAAAARQSRAAARHGRVVAAERGLRLTRSHRLPPPVKPAKAPVAAASGKKPQLTVSLKALATAAADGKSKPLPITSTGTVMAGSGPREVGTPATSAASSPTVMLGRLLDVDVLAVEGAVEANAAVSPDAAAPMAAPLRVSKRLAQNGAAARLSKRLRGL